MNPLDALETFKAVRKYDDHIHSVHEFENHKCANNGCMNAASLWSIQRKMVVAAIKVLEEELK